MIVAGVPKPVVQWLRDDKELKKGKRVLFEEEQLAEGVKYKMTIRDIVMKDFGKVSSACSLCLPFVPLDTLAITFSLRNISARAW